MDHLFAKMRNLFLGHDRPTSLIHFLTHRCNACCPHCFIDFRGEPDRQPPLSLSDIDRMTRSAGPQLMNVNLTGGEPFLVQEIEAISELYLRNTSIDSIFISTNGGFPDAIERYAQTVAARHPGTKFIVSISIDHIGSCHDQYRKAPNLFEKALESYHLLRNRGDHLMPNVTITVSQANAGEIEFIFDELTRRHHVVSLTANLVRDEGRYRTPPEVKEKILAAYATLTHLIQDGMRRGILLGMNERTLLGRLMNCKEAIMVEQIHQAFARPGYRLPCRAGGGLLGVIHPNGDVFPCELLPHKKLGNLRDFDMDLPLLWQANAPLRQWILDSRCHCTYECAWSYNLLASPRYWPRFGWSCIPSFRLGARPGTTPRPRT